MNTPKTKEEIAQQCEDEFFVECSADENGGTYFEDPTHYRKTLRKALTAHEQAVQERVVGDILHQWNKSELKLDGTAQGAVNAIEMFRNYLSKHLNTTT